MFSILYKNVSTSSSRSNWNYKRNSKYNIWSKLKRRRIMTWDEYWMGMSVDKNEKFIKLKGCKCNKSKVFTKPTVLIKHNTLASPSSPASDLVFHPRAKIKIGNSHTIFIRLFVHTTHNHSHSVLLTCWICVF